MTFDEAMGQVLRQRRYDRLMDRAFDLDRIINELIIRFVNWLLGLDIQVPDIPAADTSFFAVIFTAGAILVAAAAGCAIFFAVKRRKKRLKTMEEIFEELKTKNLDSNDLRRLARECAADGRLREAVRYVYIGVLWQIAEANVILLSAAKTNNQLKREVARNAGHLSAPFNEAVNVFNIAWFGHKPLSADAYAAYAKSAEIFDNISKNEKEATPHGQ